jgi:hypothetical protein
MNGWARLAMLTRSLTLALLVSSAAAAQYRHRVVLLERSSADDTQREVTTRVRAELGAAGFEVVALPVGDEDPKSSVEGAGFQVHPASVLLVERLATDAGEASADVELWLSDRLLRKTVVLRLRGDEQLAGPESTSRAAARIAVQAVELVKARLAELSLTRERERERERETPPRVTSPPAPVVPAPRGARPNLTGGIGLLKGFQEGQQSLTPVLRLGVALPERWTGDVLALDVRGGFIGLGRAARIEHGAGSASLRHTAVELDAVVRFLPGGRVQPFVSLGGGFLAIDVAGTAPEPYRNTSQRTISGLVSASGGLWLQPVKGFGLALEGQLIEAWSKTVVRIAGEDAAEVAAPLLLLSAGLMVEF